MILAKIMRKLRIPIVKRKWRRANPGNSTCLVRIDTDVRRIRVGDRTCGGLDVANDTDRQLIIGADCVIEDHVKFLVGIEHPTDHISTFPFRKLVAGTGYEAISKGDVVVGDGVLIGYGSIILSGVTIGQGAVICPGSVVTKDVPAHAVAGGIPAREIRDGDTSSAATVSKEDS